MVDREQEISLDCLRLSGGGCSAGDEAPLGGDELGWCWLGWCWLGCPRSYGWLAHAIEEYEDRTDLRLRSACESLNPGGSPAEHVVMKLGCRPLGLLLVAIFGLAACGSVAETDAATRDEDGAVVEGGETGLLALQIGDCWDDPTDMELGIAAVETTPCDEAHDNQFAGTTELADGDWAGEDLTWASSQSACEADFATVLDEAANTDLAIFPVYPSEESWELGDREVMCSIYAADLAKLTVDRLG